MYCKCDAVLWHAKRGVVIDAYLIEWLMAEEQFEETFQSGRGFTGSEESGNAC